MESYAIDFVDRTVVHTVWPMRLDVRLELGEAMLRRYLEKNPSEMFDGLAEVETEDLNSKDFQPEIPRRFEVIDGGVLEMDEEHAIEALHRIAAEIDHYPDTLAYEQLRRELWRTLGRRLLTAEVMPELHRIRGACEFFGKLVRDDRQAIYFGDRVQPGEAGHVLLRWQVEDNLYRVVFGDLQVRTVSAEELVALESR